jgi:trk system potassium uptake protein TrkA
MIMKFGVIGLGRFGFTVATTLAENGMEVLGVDSNEHIVASIRDLITQAVCLQVDDETTLRTIGFEEMDTVIVALGENFAGSILITALLKKKLNIPVVITRAISAIHKDILLLIGADQVVLPEHEIGIRLADNLSLPFPVLTRITKDFSLSQIIIPDRLAGKSLKKAGLQHVCIGLRRAEEIVHIEPDYVLQAGDVLIVAGSNDALKAIAK